MRNKPIATATWPQICAGARHQLAQPRKEGDELAVLLAMGVLGMDAELSKLVGERTADETFDFGVLNAIRRSA